MKKLYILIILTILIVETVYSQTIPDASSGTESNIAVTLNSYILNHPQETIHVQFDRAIYEVGDTVWFKVYVVNAYNNQLSALSKVVNIEVLDPEVSIQKVLLPVNAGMANGYLVLSADKYRSGFFKFNAFTRLMAIDGKRQFSSVLRVGTKNNLSLSSKPNTSKSETRLEFYPEGGALVAGLKSKVLVKIPGAQAKSLSIEGYVMDNQKNKVAVFKTGKSGMGLFAFTPKKNETYRAVIESDVLKADYVLPKALDSGYVLALNNVVNDTLVIRLSRSGQTTSEVRLLFQANGSIINAVKVSLYPTSAIVKVPMATLPPGLNELSLFSMDNELLANRVLYLPERQSSPSLSLSLSKEYGTHEQVKLGIKITDDASKGVLGGYSISVSKVDTMQIPERPTIYSSLLFASDTTNNSLSNFDGHTNLDKPELDMHLLSRRSVSFDWNDVLSKSINPKNYTIESGLQITGTVINTKGKPMAGAKLSLFSANDMILIDTVADNDGRFLFQNFSVGDSAEVVVRVTNLGTEKNVSIVLDEQFGSVLPAKNDSLALDQVAKNQQVQLDSNITPTNKPNTLKTVEIKSKKRPEIKGSAYPFAAAPPDYTLDAEELSKIPDLVEFLRSRFNGLMVKNNIVMGRNNHIAYRDRGYEGPMLILLNGLKIDDLSSIIPSSLSGVQIVKGGMSSMNMSTQFNGDTSFGILFLTTNRNYTSLKKGPKQTTGIVNFRMLGFQSTKEFYSPVYLSKTGTKNRDLRRTLFWKPDIITREDGTADIEFYTSDQQGIYQIVLEGIGLNGKITREVAYFKVN